MGILAWIIVGLVGGVVAKMLVPGHGPGGSGLAGIAFTIALGIAGAMLGGFLAVQLGVSNGIDGFDAGTILLAVVGAALILVGSNLLTGRHGMHI